MSRGRSRGRSLDRRYPRDGSEHARSQSVHYPQQRSHSAVPPEEKFDDGASVSSGGTYYVLPAPGQRVQVIAPHLKSPWTATPTTKSAQPAFSSSEYKKKPFFQRIFHLPRFNIPSVDANRSTGLRDDGKRLQRRHTLSNAQNVLRQRNT